MAAPRPSVSIAFLAAVACLASSSSAAAAEGSSDKPKERLICRDSQKSLGSRIRKPRRCLTAEQWRQADEDASRVPVTLRVIAPNDGRKRSQ
jgi:hypothetical protein